MITKHGPMWKTMYVVAVAVDNSRLTVGRGHLTRQGMLHTACTEIATLRSDLPWPRR